MAKYRANTNFSGGGEGFTEGEVVELDPDSWEPWITAGFFSLVEDPAPPSEYEADEPVPESHYATPTGSPAFVDQELPADAGA